MAPRNSGKKVARLTDALTPREKDLMASGERLDLILSAGENPNAIRITSVDSYGKHKLAKYLGVKVRDLPETVSLLDLKRADLKQRNLKSDLKNGLLLSGAVRSGRIVTEDELANIYKLKPVGKYEDGEPVGVTDLGGGPDGYLPPTSENVDRREDQQEQFNRIVNEAIGLNEDDESMLRKSMDVVQRGLDRLFDPAIEEGIDFARGAFDIYKGDYSSQRAQDQLRVANNMFGGQIAGRGIANSGMAALQGTAYGRTALQELANRDMNAGFGYADEFMSLGAKDIGIGTAGISQAAATAQMFDPYALPGLRDQAAQQTIAQMLFNTTLGISTGLQESAERRAQRQTDMNNIFAAIGLGIRGVEAGSGVGR